MVNGKKIELILQELIRRTNRGDRRIRVVEQRTQALESRTSAIEDTDFKQNKDIKNKIMDMEVAIKSINDKLFKIENDMNKINEQIKNFARKNEVKELENMFELLNPIKQEFVTKKELEDRLREIG